jgi:hypothetical protein
MSRKPVPYNESTHVGCGRCLYGNPKRVGLQEPRKLLESPLPLVVCLCRELHLRNTAKVPQGPLIESDRFLFASYRNDSGRPFKSTNCKKPLMTLDGLELLSAITTRRLLFANN